MTILTKAEFAAHRGVSRAYVSKLAREDRLVLTPCGRVEVEASEARMAETADPSKAGVVARHAAERVAQGVSAYLSPSAPAEPAEGAPSSTAAYQVARTKRESALAELAEIELQKANGDLVEKDRVERAAYLLGRLTRDLVLGVPKQISPSLATLSDAWEIERIITQALRGALEDAIRMSEQEGGIETAG